ncbi:MAG: hypothetical protein GY702_07355 [Desulfobulbaceae bacterium]|nr:hypothetical protein [Desulfobulbaceae bacterium]
MIDYDAQGKPVVFFEQDVDSPVDGARESRWWASHGNGGTVMLPLVMVDSGNQISNGYVDYQAVYRDLIDSALTRSPGAAISAVVNRIGDSLQFDIDVTNLSGVTLSGANLATLYAIVYDDNSSSGLTGSYVVSSARTYVTPPLLNEDSNTYSLQIEDLTDVAWSSLHAVVFLDYRPAGSTHYDMLQSAIEPEPGALEGAMKTLLILAGQNPAGINDIEDIGNDEQIGLEEAIHLLHQE